MKVILSHPTGNANVRAAVHGLTESELLCRFITSIAAFPGSFLGHLSNLKGLSNIKRRQFCPELKPYTKTFPWYELGRLIASQVGFTKLIEQEKGIFCIDAVCQKIDKKVAADLKHMIKHGTNAVYAYEDGAAYTFRNAKSLGLKCMYDLPTGYWRSARRLLAIERDRWPEWASTITGLNDSEIKLARKDEELRLADCIFVASQFTANTLQDFPDKLAPVEVIPYGFPTVYNARHFSTISNGKPLKLLFVGRLSQQKGLADLFKAVEVFGHHIQLTIVGQKPCNECVALDTALKKHRWIQTLPHDHVIQLMREHDVLAFPSLFDGFGLVITEAMSQGTPVIATERSAGPSLITHGKNGWLIEAGSISSLRIIIEELIRYPASIIEAGRQAMQTATERPWKVYRNELANAVLRNISSQS